jgi:hypothetical protein
VFEPATLGTAAGILSPPASDSRFVNMLIAQGADPPAKDQFISAAAKTHC